MATPKRAVSGNPGARLTRLRCTPFSSRQSPITVLMASRRVNTAYRPSAKTVDATAKFVLNTSSCPIAVGARNVVRLWVRWKKPNISKAAITAEGPKPITGFNSRSSTPRIARKRNQGVRIALVTKAVAAHQ